jgi:hypothetical protein
LQVQFKLPEAPRALQEIFGRPDFPKAARAVNHYCNFVTTRVVPRTGRAFHEPLKPPCLLNLHGTVYHWLRSADSMTEVNLSMEQWWMTPDPSTSTAVEELTTRCRRVLQVCNPVTNALLRTTDLAAAAHKRTVALRFEYNDAGPDVSAVYHTTDNSLPPYLHLCKWPKGDNRPFTQPLKH